MFYFWRIDNDGADWRVPEHRRFPPLWTVEEQPACYVVRDHNKQALAYIYFEEEQGRGSAAKLLSKDKALRIAANVAKLPILLDASETK